MGALGMLLDAACYALALVSGGSSWFAPSSSCSASHSLAQATDARFLRHALAAHADAISSVGGLLSPARVSASGLLRRRVLRASCGAGGARKGSIIADGAWSGVM